MRDGRRALVVLSLFAGLCVANLVRAEQARFDVILKHGTIVDGTGRVRFEGDIGIVGDRLAVVGGDIPDAQAHRVIDARGLIIAPGFIDPHAHITAIDSHPVAENFLRQGITTIVNSLHSLDQPYPLGPFLDGLRVAPNTVWTAGHTWERKRVVGLDDRAPTSLELTAMQTLVREAMDAGAIGFATGLEYLPATFAKTDELIALAKTSERPHAIYLTHLRDEGTGMPAAVDEAMRIGREGRLPVHINHIKLTGAANWGRSAAVLASIEAANRAGERVSFDLYPYTAYSTYSTVLFPGWSLAGDAEDYAWRIADPKIRARLHAEMLTLYRAQTANRLDSIRFRTLPNTRAFDGKTLADYLTAKSRPLTLDAGIAELIDLQKEGGFIGIFEAMNDRDVDAFLLHPLASITSDGDLVTPGVGFPHPRSYGAFPRILARYVRERHLLSLESAIAKMTSRPAQDLMIADRGVLRAGAFADIVVFDARRVIDRATYIDPHRYSQGIVHLFINGMPVIEAGALTGRLPGRPLRRAPY